MSFQFQCPQGHLLEGDASQAGQQCVCPMCGMLFIIPAPIAVAPDPVASPAPIFAPQFGPPGEQAPSRFAHLQVPTQPVAEAPAEVASAPAPPPEPEILHIPCPNGHELETPIDMLEQEVLCPQCNAQFKLRRKNSTEFKRKKEEQERIKEIKTGNFWLNAAIVAVVLVLLLLAGLIIMSTWGNTPVGK